MMPLAMAKTGEENPIRKIGGSPDVRKFLESLGFVAGARVAVLSENAGNVIVKARESQIAVSREMAMKILL